MGISPAGIVGTTRGDGLPPPPDDRHDDRHREDRAHRHCRALRRRGRTAVDAHDLQLVKQIEVTSFEEEDNYEGAYIRLIKTGNPASGINADIEIDKKFKSGVRRTEIKVKLGDDLYELSGNRDVYRGFQVSEIDSQENLVKFTSRPQVLTLDKHIGGIDDAIYKELQIEATIRAHLDKELRLNKKGIKVLSLFFIDRVDNYRIYNDDGTYDKGKFALMFEDLYKRIIMEDDYKELRENIADIDQYSKDVHHGYFSQDKSGTKDIKFVETKTDDLKRLFADLYRAEPVLVAKAGKNG